MINNARTGERDRKPFVAFAVAETLSLSGTRLSMIAIPWLVLTTTDSASMTGVVAFAEMLPYVITKLLAGPIVDRLGARPVAITVDVISVLVISLVPFLHWLGALQIAIVIPIVALMGALRGPSDGAKSTLVPLVSRLAAVPLERVTGAHGAIDRLATTIGALTAGGLVALIGPAWALGINAATFGCAALVIGIGIPRGHNGPADDDHPHEAGGVRRYLGQLKQGWDFLRTDAVLIGVTIMVAASNLIDQAFSTVMLPVWAKESGHGAIGIGLVAAVFAAASTLGSVSAAVWSDRLPRLTIYTVCFLIAGAPRFVIFSLQPGLPAILTVCAIAGLTSGFINPIIGAVVFERIPQSLTGRVTALNSSLAWSLMPFGGLLGGLLVTGVGLPIALLTAGAGYFVVTLMPVAKKSFRSFGVRPADDIQTALTSPASTITSDPVVLPDRGDANNTI